MELALFPIAALLLLLSGVSAPARSAVRQAGTAALMREFFGAQGLAASTPHVPTASSRILAHYLPPQPEAHSAGVHCWPGSTRHARHAGSLPYAFDCRHFRNRFGSPDSAYFALGPPLA